MSLDLDSCLNAIIHQKTLKTDSKVLLVAFSGIDGSGKGYITQKLNTQLTERNFNVATINIDGWLNLPAKRFSETNSAAHFYHHAIRFDELFPQLVFPLRDRRSIKLTADFTEETATSYRPNTYHFADIDIILLEGIYLLKQKFQSYYDLSFWIECSFKTALDRAIARSQEGLSPAETINAYQTIYFPAQKIHFERDRPQTTANAIIQNDF